MRSFGSIWNRSSPGSREATWRALAERSRNANSARLPCGTRTTALTLSAVPSNSRESMVRGCGNRHRPQDGRHRTGDRVDGGHVAAGNAPIRFNIVPTASRRPHTQAAANTGGQRGLGAVLHFDLGKHRRIPQHQRSCEHGICFPDQQRLSSTGPRRAQRHRAHPSRSTCPHRRRCRTHTNWSTRRGWPRHGIRIVPDSPRAHAAPRRAWR